MLDRRGFLKFVGGAGVGILATPVVWQGIDDTAIWSQNWPWVPDPAKGELSFATTISKCCPTGQGIRVRLLGCRPVTVHGNPDHPLSRGALNALCASEVQLLHSPARLRQPHKRGADGRHVPISWGEASALLAESLKQAKDAGGIYAVSGDPTSAVNDVLSVLTGRGNGTCFLMPGEEQAARRAWKLMNGRASAGVDLGRLGYDL
ncbi:MAG: twin-arginine translocation signal domain-containing protein, partial [Deltaproteobacteria bacterium]|nr:twin-arginine translocation signal domain-containing protein [Deltaproteobacteria bacterium]